MKHQIGTLVTGVTCAGIIKLAASCRLETLHMQSQLVRLTMMQAALVRRAIDIAADEERRREEAYRRAGDHNEAHWCQVRRSDLLDLDRELVTAMNPMDRKWRAVFAGIPRPEVETLHNNQVENEGH